MDVLPNLKFKRYENFLRMVDESKESDKSERSRCRHALMLVLAIGAVVFFVVFLVLALTDWRM